MRAPYRGNRCQFCGEPCVASVDNDGKRYMGCPSCVAGEPRTEDTDNDPDEMRKDGDPGEP